MYTMTTVGAEQGRVVISLPRSYTRGAAASLLVDITEAIVNAGDICDPKAQNLLAAVSEAVHEFMKESND